MLIIFVIDKFELLKKNKCSILKERRGIQFFSDVVNRTTEGKKFQLFRGIVIVGLNLELHFDPKSLKTDSDKVYVLQ